MQEQYTVQRTIPDHGMKPVIYISVGNRLCQLPPSLRLKPGDIVHIQRAKEERPSDQTASPAGGYRDRKKPVLLNYDRDD
jgi:hypothetical protein